MSTETRNGRSNDVPRRRTDEILAALAERLGATFTASSVFGTPVERDGVTVIPVAAIRFGFGGGGGEDASSEQRGEGGGGGGLGGPAGYIEIKDGESRFVPIVHPARVAVLGSGVALAAALALRVARGARA